MPGHHSLEKINNDGVRTVAGKLNQVGSFGAITNTGSPPAMPAAVAGVDYQGYARGAFLINTTGTSSATTVYVNLGTTTTASWTALTIL